MLKDRVHVETTAGGFRVEAEEGTNRQVYFGYFSLKDDPDVIPQLEGETTYWTGGNNFVQAVKWKQCFIIVVEKENGEIVDTHRFYYSTLKGKKELSIKTKAKGSYGKGAHLITIEWTDGSSEQINGKRMYLTNKDGEKFFFLTEVISPAKPDAKKPKDEYVYVVPEGDNPDKYYVEVDEFVKCKYVITN